MLSVLAFEFEHVIRMNTGGEKALVGSTPRDLKILSSTISTHAGQGEFSRQQLPPPVQGWLQVKRVKQLPKIHPCGCFGCCFYVYLLIYQQPLDTPEERCR